MIKDENLSLEDKQKLAQNLVERYLRENGYQGVIPEVLLTDEAHSFTVDSKDKETGAKREEKIYFSINDIANPDLVFSQLFGHEKAHMNTYDEGKYGEETSIHTREKIGSENKNKVFTEEEKADYLSNLRDKYKNQKSIEQQFAEAKLVPEKDKEHWAVGETTNISAEFIGRVNVGRTKYTIYNENTGELERAKTTDLGVGLGMIGASGGKSLVFLKNINTAKELNSYSFVIGGGVNTLKVFNIGGELLYDEDKKFIGLRISGGLTKSISDIKFKPPISVYGSIDNTIVTSSKIIKKSKEEIEKQIGYDLDKISELAKDEKTALKNILIISDIMVRISTNMEELKNDRNNRKTWRR